MRLVNLESSWWDGGTIDYWWDGWGDYRPLVGYRFVYRPTDLVITPTELTGWSFSPFSERFLPDFLEKLKLFRIFYLLSHIIGKNLAFDANKDPLRGTCFELCSFWNKICRYFFGRYKQGEDIVFFVTFWFFHKPVQNFISAELLPFIVHCTHLLDWKSDQRCAM